MAIFNERIKKTREEKNINQKEIAERADIKREQYARYEKGQEPGIYTATKIAEALEISLDYLTGRTDNPEINK